MRPQRLKRKTQAVAEWRYWEDRAEEARAMAEGSGDPEAHQTMLRIAKEYEDMAKLFEPRSRNMGDERGLAIGPRRGRQSRSEPTDVAAALSSPKPRGGVRMMDDNAFKELHTTFELRSAQLIGELYAARKIIAAIREQADSCIRQSTSIDPTWIKRLIGEDPGEDDLY